MQSRKYGIDDPGVCPFDQLTVFPRTIEQTDVYIYPFRWNLTRGMKMVNSSG